MFLFVCFNVSPGKMWSYQLETKKVKSGRH